MYQDIVLISWLINQLSSMERLLSCKLHLWRLFLKITPSADESEYAKVQISLALMRYRDFLDAQQVRRPLRFLLLLNFHLSCNCSFDRHKSVEPLCLSTGVWWQYAGETLCSTSVKDWSKHGSHVTDCHFHCRLGWLLEWDLWEVRYCTNNNCTLKSEQILEEYLDSINVKDINTELKDMQ